MVVLITLVNGIYAPIINQYFRKISDKPKKPDILRSLYNVSLLRSKYVMIRKCKDILLGPAQIYNSGIQGYTKRASVSSGIL